jgi:hypothetical protein
MNPPIPPSLLARKIICPAYVPRPLPEDARLRLLGLHAMTALRVIRRHLGLGYHLRDIEKRGNGCRADLVFQDTSGRLRVCEVKSARVLTRLHHIQTALYSNRDYDEVVLSNREADIPLSRDYIDSVLRQAQTTRELLINHAREAASTFRPDEEVCRTCSNQHCPILRASNSPTSGQSRAN